MLCLELAVLVVANDPSLYVGGQPVPLVDVPRLGCVTKNMFKRNAAQCALRSNEGGRAAMTQKISMAIAQG